MIEWKRTKQVIKIFQIFHRLKLRIFPRLRDGLEVPHNVQNKINQLSQTEGEIQDCSRQHLKCSIVEIQHLRRRVQEILGSLCSRKSLQVALDHRLCKIDQVVRLVTGHKVGTRDPIVDKGATLETSCMPTVCQQKAHPKEQVPS